MTTVRSDVYSRVTDQILAELEAGVRPWVQPWNTGHATVSRPLRYNAMPYRGINVVLLWMAALRQHFTCPLWMTYKQAVQLGGQVRKGAKGSLVVYADTFTKSETGDDGQEQQIEVPFLKSYTVFNCEQIDGLPAHYYAKAEQPIHPIERIERAEQFAANTGADIRYGGGMAYYSPADDSVQIPPLTSFRTAAAYYATLHHELCHWTRAPARLNRQFGRQRFGDEGYAMEELVAELGAAFLCADLGLTLQIRDDHAAYWLLGQAAQERETRHLHCRRPRPACRRLPARIANH